TLQMSQARGYATGGSIHVVINNQIGFTTSNPLDTRSTLYCTDVGKMVQTPIFHVNGDDPEAVIFVTRVALDYRMRFHKDVIIDLVCYRRHGHNEADEPAVTQPQMYQKIRRMPTTRSVYADRLISQGITTPEQVRDMVENYRTSLEQGSVVARPTLVDLGYPYHTNFKTFENVHWEQPADTRITEERLRRTANKLLELPEGFEPHPRIAKILAERHKMATGDQLVDWGFGETLAYATLVQEGYPVRLSGQDCGRGTFFHRHAVLHNQLENSTYTPLEHLHEYQADFTVIDS
ncbi:MAG: 2-oxoglutarate dehydrogenase E1 component, partial [Gammaproteobacteria bacterium]|nr:2-oxoglutarate dehydrogenase E1 component [Gammaproteobacteria bacterium]